MTTVRTASLETNPNPPDAQAVPQEQPAEPAPAPKRRGRGRPKKEKQPEFAVLTQDELVALGRLQVYARVVGVPMDEAVESLRDMLEAYGKLYGE